MTQTSCNELLAVCIRDPRNELVRLECEALTGGVPDKFGVARCERVEAIRSACYVRIGLRTIVEAGSLEELVELTRSADFDSIRFRVELKRLTRTVQVDRWDAMRLVADAIPDHPDMIDPIHRFMILVREGWWTLGEVLSERLHDYRKHDRKPWRTSSSLPSQLARAIVNVVAHRTNCLADPCCGVGSVLLEACALGIRAFGSDYNRRMVGMSRENLAFFDYDAQVSVEDARDWRHTADAIVTDLPYGQKLAMSETDARLIMERSIQAAPVAVFVAGSNVSDWLSDAGYGDVSIFRVPKQTGFTRYVHLAERSP